MYARNTPRWFTRGASYRDRSHFDGQDVLESGFAGPGRVQSGWLNRALEALPEGRSVMSGLAIGPTTPLVLRARRRPSPGRRSRCRRPPTDTAMAPGRTLRHRVPRWAHVVAKGLQLARPRKATT